MLRGASPSSCVGSDGDDDGARLPSITCREGQKAFRRKLREIYLHAVRAAYWEQLSAGALPEGLPSMMLLQSVDEAVDKSHLHRFFDWQELQVRVFSVRADPSHSACGQGVVSCFNGARGIATSTEVVESRPSQCSRSRSHCPSRRENARGLTKRRVD